MIYQAVINDSTASQTFLTPFIGVFRIRLRRIEYHKNVGPLQEELIQITSQSIINGTPLSGNGNRIVFLNSACNNSGYDDEFIIGENIRISGAIDLNARTFPTGGTLPAGAGGYNSICVTLDFEKLGD